MINIICHGYPYIRVRCSLCGCEFECTPDEITHRKNEYMDKFGFETLTVKCPNCGIEISWDDMKGHNR